jgi:hypothetical protein
VTTPTHSFLAPSLKERVHEMTLCKTMKCHGEPTGREVSSIRLATNGLSVIDRRLLNKL